MADQDHVMYGILPDTGHPGGVPYNWTDHKNKIHNMGWGGCNPARWIYELLNNNFTTCDLFTRAQQANLEVPYPWQDHTHRLILNGNQSFVSLGARMLSSVCIDCHFHFVFNLLWDEEHASALCNHNQKQWPPRDGRFPWHHLAWAGTDSDENIAKRQSKYYPLVTRETFACSAGPCTFSINLEISMPRMPLWWINLLLDSDTIREELRIAKENDPERYATATDDWAMQAPINLNTYLKNLIEATSQEGARSISKRNKRFAVLFGPRCFSIFRELEFDETIDIREDDGVDEGTFTPKVPYPPDAPNGATKIGTYRGYIEDVRAEVQCLIHKRGEAAELCIPSLHAYLGCSEVPNVSSNVFVNLDRYKLMGVLPNQDKGIVDNAYRRQWELLPKKRRELIEALGQIANDLNDRDFSEYAMMQESVFGSQAPTQTDNGDAELTNQALLFFGLQPPNNYNADSIVLAYRRKVVNDPSDAATALSMLMLISNATSDESYRRSLEKEYEEKFSLTTAKEILGLSDASIDSDTLDNFKQKVQNTKGKEAKTTYLDAMDKIADHTQSTELKREVAQLRQQNDIIGSDLVNTSNSNQPADYDLPVGLENIGNTCYLNSLLQYLFTVKPVRDIAVRYDDFKLDLTDETIEHRRIGGNKMRMKREEAVVAQAFAKELSELFTKLENSDMRATRPSQRLANAVLLDTDTLVKSANTSADSATANQPPPLPTRPPPGPPANDSEDVEMATTDVKDDRDPIDTASTVSSQTLIGDDSDRSYDKVETSPATNGGQVIDTVMEVEQDDDVVEISRPSHQADEVVGTPEKRNIDDSKKDQSTDTDMTDAKEPSTIDQKVLTALEHQDRSSGTDQQDVEEVMGNIISRLQAAIQPSYVNDVTGIQMESIMETFFVTTINYTKKADEDTYQKEISFDRFITAFPSPQGGTCSLYDALGRNFDRQAIEGSEQSRYTAIETLPPVLHVLIQRSQSVNGKNDNPVEIPETLYLDRFMDTPHDSMTFKEREKSWAAANRISEINASIAAAESTGTTGPFLESLSQEEKADDSNAPTMEDIAMVDGGEDAEETWEFDGPVDDDFLVVNRPSKRAASATELSDVPQNINEIESAVREQMKTELKETTDHLETYYAQLKSNPYRLHAVICHRGSLRSGHYWVWIYDFEQNVWRKYNDSNVEVKHSTDEVLKTLSSSGEPYFLCYVRDEDKEEYVDVPRRRRPAGSGADQELPPPYLDQGNN